MSGQTTFLDRLVYLRILFLGQSIFCIAGVEYQKVKKLNNHRNRWRMKMWGKVEVFILQSVGIDGVDLLFGFSEFTLWVSGKMHLLNFYFCSFCSYFSFPDSFSFSILFLLLFLSFSTIFCIFCLFMCFFTVSTIETRPCLIFSNLLVSLIVHFDGSARNSQYSVFQIG